MSKPKRQVNAFSFVSSPPFHPCPYNWIGYRREDGAKVVQLVRKSKNYPQNVVNLRTPCTPWQVFSKLYIHLNK